LAGKTVQKVNRKREKKKKGKEIEIFKTLKRQVERWNHFTSCKGSITFEVAHRRTWY
jgi:hypothetical protein